MRRAINIIVGVATVTLMGAPAALAAPDDGEGNKFVDVVENVGIPVDCDEDGTADLWLDEIGFVQGRGFSEENRNVVLIVFHLDLTFTNADGDTWVWRDRGPDRAYVDEDGDFILAVNGRSGSNNIGRYLFNFSTFEVEQQAGRAPFGGEPFGQSPFDEACRQLT